MKSQGNYQSHPLGEAILSFSRDVTKNQIGEPHCGLEEKSGDHQSKNALSSGEHYCLHKMRYFRLDQSSGPTDRPCHPLSQATSMAKSGCSAKGLQNIVEYILYVTTIETCR